MFKRPLHLKGVRGPFFVGMETSTPYAGLPRPNLLVFFAELATALKRIMPMYAGPADVTFFHKYLPLPPDRLDVYYNFGVDITLSDFQPQLAQLVFDAGLVGVEDATHVRVRLPDGLEYEGEIKPRPTGPGVMTLLFMVERVETPTVSLINERR